MSEELKRLILEKRKEGKIVFMTVEGPMSVDKAEFIKQPADGILYDLNRLEEVALTFLDDPKWVNNFAVALTIRELKQKIDQLEEEIETLRKLAIPMAQIIKPGRHRLSIVIDEETSDREKDALIAFYDEFKLTVKEHKNENPDVDGRPSPDPERDLGDDKRSRNKPSPF